jgi:nondiscriminating glutamyl-tRNA synthetase
MLKNSVRLRFAPSPTGMMHLGNIRAALMNFLFARQKDGTFILRIEDTDPERNFDVGAQQIIADLAWLGLTYDEGPILGGPYVPYFQSERTDLYAKALQELIDKNLVYRCFCTTEELEKRRARQIALKKPPRYDRACLNLPAAQVESMLAQKTPFIWRLQLDASQSVTVQDLAHGPTVFELKNFSDFPLTRSDGTFTFIFANFVDDMLMKITHAVRGEDHLTNTACQAALFIAFNAPMPTYWHLPVMCNVEGKKLSKRDFGFSLKDLKDEGFLPEAVLNYLAIIGGGSFTNEIMSLDELIAHLNFDNIHATGRVKYNVEKLRWMNNKWINRIDRTELYTRCMPFLVQAYPMTASMDSELLCSLLEQFKPEFVTLKDAVTALKFYFERPTLSADDMQQFTRRDDLRTMVADALAVYEDSEQFVQGLKAQAKERNVPIKELFGYLRLALMASTQGPAINELINALGSAESRERLMHILHL